MIRARFLFAVVVVADMTILLCGIPLLHDTYLALSQRAGDAQLLQLLAANVAMLLLMIGAMLAWGMLGARVLQLVRLDPTIFGRPIRAQRTKYRR